MIRAFDWMTLHYPITSVFLVALVFLTMAVALVEFVAGRV